MVDQLVTLAIGSGRSHAEVYEYWLERAAHREHSAGYPRAEAERLAVLDTEDWLKENRRG